jgi:predicted nucleotidyltransferase
MNPRLKTMLTKLRARFEALYGDKLVKLVLYDSEARGDAAPDSDIDVLAVIEGDVAPGQEIERTGDTVSEISLEHD